MNTPTTAKQKKLEFDKLHKQIENDDLRLKTLETELQRLQMRLATGSIPLVEEFCQLRFENLTKLKLYLTDSFFKKKEIRHINFLILQLAQGLQEVGDERAQSFLKEMIPDEESFLEVETKRFETPQLIDEGRVEIKSLFRELAKAFHPDKEPMEHLKEERTSLMKKITAAYENQDLYGLLKIEKENIGPREFSEDKIELYKKHINIRQKELKAFEARLKKHGPLASIYKFIYSQKAEVQEGNIKAELKRIESEVQKEKELQQILWDRVSLRNFL